MKADADMNGRAHCHFVKSLLHSTGGRLFSGGSVPRIKTAVGNPDMLN